MFWSMFKTAELNGSVEIDAQALAVCYILVNVEIKFSKWLWKYLCTKIRGLLSWMISGVKKKEKRSYYETVVKW